MYVLPSAFTAGNIAAGFYAITESIRGAGGDVSAFNRAALAIGFAIVFDGVDGRVARMTRTTSDFGKELDSLADVVTFGVAPAVLAWIWGFRMLDPGYLPSVRAEVVPLGIVACFAFLICGACRLARFNISVNPQPRNPGRPDRKYFVGMPIPAGAGVIGAVVHFEAGSPIHNLWLSLVWLALVAFTGFLMVSSWRFWSGKEIDMGERKPGRFLIFLVVLIGIIVEWHQTALLVIALGYLVSGVMARVAYSWQRRFAAP